MKSPPPYVHSKPRFLVVQELRSQLEEQVLTNEKAKVALRSAEQKHQEEKARIDGEWKLKLEQVQVGQSHGDLQEYRTASVA